MKQQFMTLHNEGYLIPEIAEQFNLSAMTVYRHLGEIADENGVTREELLKVIRGPYSERAFREESERIHATAEELLKGLKRASEAIQSTINRIDMILEEEEQYDYDYC